MGGGIEETYKVAPAQITAFHPKFKNQVNSFLSYPRLTVFS